MRTHANEANESASHEPSSTPAGGTVARPGPAPSQARAARLGHRLGSGGNGGGGRSEQAIQAKLTLVKKDNDSSDAYRKKNRTDLNEMLKGSGASVDYNDESGAVSFNHGEDAEIEEDHKGYQLLKRMIAHDHEVKIQDHHESDNAKTAVDSTADAEDATKGSGSTIKIGKDATSDSLVDDGKGNITKETTARHLLLAHELVHADRSQRGYRMDKGMVAYPVEGSYRSSPRSDSVPVKREYMSKAEEADTVGLGPTKPVTAGLELTEDPEAITENDIRKELGEKRRAIYEADLDGFMTVARTPTRRVST